MLSIFHVGQHVSFGFDFSASDTTDTFSTLLFIYKSALNFHT